MKKIKPKGSKHIIHALGKVRRRRKADEEWRAEYKARQEQKKKDREEGFIQVVVDNTRPIHGIRAGRGRVIPPLAVTLMLGAIILSGQDNK